MSNFQDAISAEDLKALYSKASTKEQMTQDAPWKGTGESVGDPELGIVQQAIDAVDDNCEFSITEFLKGSHFSLFLYLRNIEMQLQQAMTEGDKDAIMALSMQFGQVQSVYNALTDILPTEEGDEDEDA
jgi:hypothetical protein